MAKSVIRVVRSVSEYIDAIADIDESDDLLLRGQRRVNWPLLPSVSRLILRPGDDLVQTEHQLLDGFLRRCLPYVDIHNKDAYDMLAMAQHHGLVTRLLDRTGNPLAALWFAVRVPADDRTSGLVTAFVPNPSDMLDRLRNADPFLVPRTQFFQPRHLNARIIAQDGWFSVHKWNKTTSAFTRLDRLSAYASRIKRFAIPHDRFADLRAHLDRLGVNHATMFPGLDGISSHLNWSHSLLADE